MAGRSRIKNPINKILDIVRREVIDPGAPDRTSAANFKGIQGGGSAPAQEYEMTRQGEDEDGNTITLYDAMTELDSTESLYAFTSTEI